MKKLIFGLILWISGNIVSAQTFSQVDTILLPATHRAFGRLVDLQTDGWQEYVLFRYDTIGSSHISAFVFSDTLKTIDTLSFENISDVHFDVTYWNSDLRAVLLTSQQNEDSLFYQANQVIDSMVISKFMKLDTIRRVEFADLDHDGNWEALLENQNHDLMILEKIGNNWEIKYDSLELYHVQNWTLTDEDGDGWKELLYSQMSDSLTVSYLIFSQDSLASLDTLMDLSFVRQLQAFDFNNDRRDDLLMGRLLSGDSLQLTVLYGDTTLYIDLIDSVRQFDLYTADFNADGWIDIHLTAEAMDSLGFTVLYLQDTVGVFIATDTTWFESYPSVSFGDLNNDGHLDRVASWLNDTAQVIVHYSNMTLQRNLPPDVVKTHFIFSLPGKLAVVWEPVADDHSPRNAITYDLSLGNSPFSSEYNPSNFDPNLANRALQTSGKINDTTYLFTGLNPGVYHYNIQSIDQSFHYWSLHVSIGGGGSGGEGGGGEIPICNGRPLACGYSEVCETQIFEHVYVCDGDDVSITFDERTPVWSLQKGYLGQIKAYKERLLRSDTLFVANNECGKTSAYALHLIKDREIFLAESQTVCRNSWWYFNAQGADSTYWFDQNTGIVTHHNYLDYVADVDNKLIVKTYYKQCYMTDTIQINVSEPIFEFSPDSVGIVKGQTIIRPLVQGYEYEWVPSDWLSDPNSNAPEISARESVVYHVTGTDSLGCTNTDSLKVIVIDQGWLPTLFTPNNDGNNDELLIYGLENVSDFLFVIQNREGLEVYRTANIQQAISIGWDGTRNGNPLPVGVYTWRIRGVLDDGSPANLNGKTNGSIYLLR